MKIKELVSLRVYRRGRLVVLRQGHNLVTAYGKNLAASIFKNTADAERVTRLAVGDGSAQPDESQVDLANELGPPWTRFVVTGASSLNICTFTSTIVAPANATVRELGLFSSAVGSNMAARWLTSEFSITTGDEADLTWGLNFGGD